MQTIHLTGFLFVMRNCLIDVHHNSMRQLCDSINKVCVCECKCVTQEVYEMFDTKVYKTSVMKV